MKVQMSNEMQIILENTAAVIYIIDLASNEILYANKKCKEEFGDIINKICYKVLQKDQNINPLLLPFETTYDGEHENSINHKHYL